MRSFSCILLASAQATRIVNFTLNAMFFQVVVVEQNKLRNGSGDPSMTVAEAIDIATRALAGSVQAIVDAVNAPQLLHLCAGAPAVPVQYDSS